MKHSIRVSTLLFSALILGCGRDAEYVDFGLPKVKVFDLSSPKSTTSEVYFPAVANAAERSRLSFRVGGEVRKIFVQEGDELKKGDLIAKLDDNDYQLAVDNAQARFNVIDSQFKRSKTLVKKGSLAQSQFDEIAANRQIALAELELAKLRLSFTKMYAPIDGVISRVEIDQFENIQVGQPIVNIHSLDSVEVLVQLPDRLYTKQLRPQDELANHNFVVKLPSGNEFDAKVKEYTSEPDPATGTYTATLSMPMPEEELILDGMGVEVTANADVLGLNQGLYVPIGAIFNFDGALIERQNKYVWLLQPDDTVTKQAVVTGNANQKGVQILDGLSKESRIVTAGISALREGMKVQVVDKVAGNE